MMRLIWASTGIRLWATVLLVGAFMAGCDAGGGSAVSNPGSPVSELHDRIQQNGSVTFRSWNGKWIGTDCDTEITLLPDQVAYMHEHGYSVSGYRGTYEIEPDGQVTIDFSGYGHEWPVMLLQRDSTSLLLKRKDSDPNFIMGNRGGASVSSGQGTYWPFRPVSSDDEARIREDVRKSMNGS